MKYPSINKQPLRTISVPELSGGINLRDAVTLIADNQLTDSKNMWFKDSMLKTRPGLKLGTQIIDDNYTSENSNGQVINNGAKVENAVKNVAGKEYKLISCHTEHYTKSDKDTGSWTPSNSHIQFCFAGDGDTLKLPSITSDSGKLFLNYFVIQNKKTLYCFAKTESGGDVYSFEDGNEAWKKLSEEDFYAPIIMTHCKYGGGMVQTAAKCGGTMLEGCNLLGSYVRSIWSTVNKEQLSTDGKQFMIYGGLNNDTPMEKQVGMKYTAEITDKNGNKYTHSVTITSDDGWNVEQTNQGDNIYLAVCKGVVRFFTSASQSGDTASVSADDYVEDNMIITAPYISENREKELNKVFGMQRQIWYGGDAAGISGGTRLFLGSNKEDEEKNLVIWGGLNNPLYFPENCYAYVGNSNQAVTAFGRQSDTLVIFKESETYYTQYVKGDTITAADLIDQKIVDYTASVVYFPMILLNANIGCNCPDTLQLCRNRLVWACSNGNLYTLCSENQYNERSIYPIGDMINRRLKTEKTNVLAKARSADFDNRYFLFVGSHIYVMEYESYGYAHIYSYSKSEDAQQYIPWWYWELPFDVSDIFIGNGMLSVVSGNGDNRTPFGSKILLFDEEITADVDGIIRSMIQTKIFDFGMPAYTKKIPLVNIAFGNNGGAPINVAFVTDRGKIGDDTVTLCESSEDAYSPEYVHNRQLRPFANSVCRLGVRAECKGVMSISSISLDYRMLGGAK